MLSKARIVQFRFVYTRFTNDLRPFTLACAVSHAAAFEVNDALLASQWLHRASTVPLAPTQGRAPVW